MYEMLIRVMGYADISMIIRDMINRSIDPGTATYGCNVSMSEIAGVYMGRVVSKNELEEYYEEFGHLFHSSYKDMSHNGIVFYDLMNKTSRVVVDTELPEDKQEEYNKILREFLHPKIVEEDPILLIRNNGLVKKHWPLGLIIAMIFYTIGVLSQKYFP